MRFCFARTMPSTTGFTASRWDGFDATDTASSAPDGRGVRPGGAEVVHHVARALRRARVDVALEAVEDLGVALADDVREDVQTARGAPSP